ncbi:MAG: Uma2 family endonuclease [Cyanobacteriota bacterium]|nr:Uma2 family endonuclease [Cyanobacteriota bacterium]
MTYESPSEIHGEIVYPSSERDLPTAATIQQFRWLSFLKENLELMYADVANVMVAEDLMWYPIEGRSEIRQAPDVTIVFGRPKGDRDSYKQWEEGNIAPQVVFEVVYPGYRLVALGVKWDFYSRYGVEEYYAYDPRLPELAGWIRREGEEKLDFIDEIEEGWTSPRLGIRFEVTPEGLSAYRPDGEKFLSFLELGKSLQQERQRADDAIAQLETLKAQLKEKGIELNN